MLWLTGFTCNLFASNIARRTWILEQMAAPISQSYRASEKGLFRSGLSVANYSDALSTQAGVIGDLGPLEAGLYGSQRVYGTFSDDGAQYQHFSEKEIRTFGVEIARSYISRDGHAGRLGVQYIRFLPASTSYFRVGVNMGIFERKDFPWTLRINTHVFFKGRAESMLEGNVISTSVEIGQKFRETGTSLLRVGGLFGWTYRTRTEEDVSKLPEYFPLRNEHMLFSVGPWAEFLASTYSVKLSIPWRIWLDKETYRKDLIPGQVGSVVHYPTDVRLPDVTLQLNVFL